MTNLPFAIVDVFATTARSGNQLAVVFEAGHLPTEVMQQIAREFDFSETTFVNAGEITQAVPTRIFMPSAELPFAGHPTIGTAWALREHVERRDLDELTLQLGIGDVPVRFIDNLVWMQPPTASLGETMDPGRAATILGLRSDDLDGALPARLARIGPGFLLIPVADRDVLRRATPDAPAWRELAAEHGWLGLFAFTRTADGWAARMFFEACGVREDAATGSANACFAGYLAEHVDATLDTVVEQGVEMGRPSRLHLRVANGVTHVGGRVIPFATGSLTVPD